MLQEVCRNVEQGHEISETLTLLGPRGPEICRGAGLGYENPIQSPASLGLWGRSKVQV